MTASLKKTFGILCAGMLVAACTANTTADIDADLDGTSSSSEVSADVVTMEAGVVMEEGTMMVITVDGEKMEMTEEVKLENGTTVSADGEVLMADGTKMMLKDGDGVSMDGEVLVKGQAMVGDESDDSSMEAASSADAE